MAACLDKSLLESVQVCSPEGRTKNDLHSEFIVGEFAQENQTKLKQLEQERGRLQWVSCEIGLACIARLGVYNLSALVSLPFLSSLAGKLQTTSQRFLLMTELIEAFEDEGIAIEVGLKSEGLKEIDFFLRFPDKEFILIQIQALSGSKVVYNEKLEALQYRQRKGNLKTWKPDPLLELVAQEQWIRKQRSDLLGVSSRDRKSPMAKLLVLWSNTELGNLSEGLYDRLNESKYTTIRRRSTFNIVPRNQVVDFVKDYLASRRSPKSS